MSIDDCNIIQLVKISDPRGDIGVIEGLKHIPFEIKRIDYSYNVPLGVARGGHGHKKLHQLVILTSGSLDITLDDGTRKKKLVLNRPDQGLYICPMVWRDLDNFSSDAVCLVLASDYYDEFDYYRKYEDFMAAVKEQAA